MADELLLEELLNEHWLAAIGELVRAQPEAAKYLGIKRDVATIPERSLTFTSLNQLPPKDINVVIFGQDPYPRAESAIGVAFNDGAIHQWTDKFSPSFANIIKNLLYGKGKVSVDQGVADVRKLLAKESIVAPPAWFAHTIKNGVCWLNTSLTFTSVDTSILALHLAFWRPIVEGIVSALIDAKRELVKTTNPKAGLVFVLWGGHAQKLKKMVEKINKSSQPSIDIRFVDAPHPAANGATFHSVKSFVEVDKALASLGLPPIEWLPSLQGRPPVQPPVLLSESLTPTSSKKASSAKKVTTAKKASTKEEEDDASSTSEEEVAPVKKAKKATAAKKVTAAKKATAINKRAHEEDDSSEEDAPPAKKSKKATTAKKSTPKKRSRDDDDDDDDFSAEEAAPPAKKRAKKVA